MNKKYSPSIIQTIILLSIVLRCAVALMMGDQIVAMPGIYDQISYYQLAARVLGGYGFSFETDWWPLLGAGQPTAFWSYLYTFYLVAVYALFGLHPLAARLIQALLVGALMPWLVYRLARRLFPDGPQIQLFKLNLDVPLLAAAWTAFYGYLIYYSAALMTETFYILGILWSLDCALRLANQSQPLSLRQPASAWLYLEFGLALAFTLLMRQVFLLFLPFLLCWLWWANRRTTRQSSLLPHAVRGALLSLLLAASLILPFTAYNYLRFGRFVLLNTNAGYAFFWANHPFYGTRFLPADEMTEDYRRLIPQELHGLNEAELDSRLMALGVQFVLQDPLRYLWLSLSRIPVYFEFWPSAQSPLLSNLTRFFSFGILLPFAILGLWLLFRAPPGRVDLPGFALLCLFAAVYSLVHLASWAMVRYRLPVDAVLIVFGAYGLHSLLVRWRPSIFAPVEGG